jgi:hypothetical protein
VSKGDQPSFYVYAFLRGQDSEHGKKGTPYYIGKGKGRRRFADTGRCCARPSDSARNVILKQQLTESEAFRWETFYINHYGRIDNATGILHNKSNGGEGVSGRIFSPESRRKQSANMMARLNDPQKKLALFNAIKNSSLQEERNQKIATAAKARWQNPEKRAAITKSITDWANKPETKRKLGASRIKVLYQLTDPTGEIYCTHSMRDFCLQYKLCPTCLGLVVKGKRKDYKGWTACIIERYV